MNNTYDLGHVTTTHKLIGSVKISTKFKVIDEIVNIQILARKGEEQKILTVKKVEGITNSKAILTFNEITNIDEAKKLVGFHLNIRKDLLPHYEEEKSVIGYEVFENKERIGEVVDILETSAHDILVIEGVKEILVPFIDVFVKNIDDDSEVIEVELIEGMRWK